MPEVSAIIPCYNQGHYLNEAIDSILGQDMDDWEAVIVDDGSTDDTAEVARGYSDRRIHYVHQENRGLSGARNAGIMLSQGRCLAFLDADDEWEPAFFRICLGVLNESTSAVGVYTWNSFIDADGRRLPQEGKISITPQDFRRRLLEGGFFPVHAAMVRIKAMQAVGFFDENLTSLEDWELWLRLTEHGVMVGIPQSLARYRIYPGSMSTDAEQMQANRLAVLEKHFGQINANLTHWNEEKRFAYALAYRDTALAFLQQGQPGRCWQLLAKATSMWPDIVDRLDTYYELAYGEQPRGYRHQVSKSELRANGQAILGWLDSLFASAPNDLQAKRKHAIGQAYLALAMLADQIDDWSQARVYLRRAMTADPLLVSDGSVLRRMLKLHAGWRIVSRIRDIQLKSR